jgi:hypothetical protein
MIIKDTKLKGRYFISLNIMLMYSRIANFKPQKSTQLISIFFRKTHKTCQSILELLILNLKKVYNTFQYFLEKHTKHKTFPYKKNHFKVTHTKYFHVLKSLDCTYKTVNQSSIDHTCMLNPQNPQPQKP